MPRHRTRARAPLYFAAGLEADGMPLPGLQLRRNTA
jgi:hypothetical protein